MSVLKLSLLGPFSASYQDKPIQNFKTIKVQALFIYLVMERDRTHRRESLMELLWPETPLESAQVNLRQTVYRLRQLLPDLQTDGNLGAIPVVISDRHFVGLNPEIPAQTDVDRFRELIKKDPIRAIETYRGDFLSDFYLVDSNAFESWAEIIREGLRRNVLEILMKLATRAIESGDYRSAQSFAWRQLEIDRFRESAYRQLMIALAQSGQRNAALAQFQICQRRLKEGLGIDPSNETVVIYEQIQSDALRLTSVPKPTTKRGLCSDMPVFLLTDIESSTRLWDTYHQEMLPALLKHNAILEDEINKHGGRILELRGDGVKAVFEGVNPFQCMIDIQKSLNEADWGEIGSLKIRIGLHGVPSIRKGYDYFQKNDSYYGPVLNHTARIMDAAWGGQILVSGQVHNAFSLPEGASWQDFGLHSLKSLDHPIHIYGLLHPDLPAIIYPPIRTLTTEPESTIPETTQIKHNIPPQQTPFVGRPKELAVLKDLLAEPQNQLVTIVGPGGIGKTRLAIAAAESQIENCLNPESSCAFPDGVFFIPLVSINDPEGIMPAIAKVLKLPLEGSQTPEILETDSQTSADHKEKLTGYLHSHRMLIILDNFEHLLDGAGIISELLSTGPSTRFLTTSRERLHIYEEQIFPIQGLDFPDWESPDDPCEYTAMQLFLQSARRVQPNFELAPGDMVYLTRICRMVEGMPLGLELAASWVDMLSLEDIATEIQTSLDFLETDIRNIPDRHQSIRAVFDSSWGRLSDSEKQIFPRLSVFRGTFTRQAAGEVAQASLRNLATFVSKSLIHFDSENNHYHIHELLRQYGVEQLATNPRDHNDTYRRHCTYFCDQLERNTKLVMFGNIQWQTMINRMESLANIQVAWDWAVKNRDIENINKAVNGICLYNSWSMRIEDGQAVCNSALEILDDLSLSDKPPDDPDRAILKKHLCARILSWQGYYTIYSNHEHAKKLLDQSLTILRELEMMGVDVGFDQVWILFFQAQIDYLAGDKDSAKDILHQGLVISRTAKFQFMVFEYLSFLGDIARTSGLPREAKKWYLQSLEESRAQNNPGGEIIALNDLGWAARSMMVYDEARHYYEGSFELSREINDQLAMVFALQSLGWLSLFLGDLDQAAVKLTEAYDITYEMGMPHRGISSQVNLGVVYWLSGDFSRAEVTIRDSLTLSNEMSPGSRVFPMIYMAELLTLMGRYPEAKSQIQILNVLSRDIYLDRFTEGRLTRVLGHIAIAEKAYTTAVAHFQKSIDLYQVESDDEQIAWSQAGLAHALMGQRKWDEAHQLLTEALWTSIEIKGFIPLVFTLPVLVSYLAHDDPSQAAGVLKQIQVSPFITNARYFFDTVFQFLPEDIRVTPIEEVAPNPNEILWNTAASVLSKWIQAWMVPFENDTGKSPGNHASKNPDAS
jgi:DNA-binding SARP family transcriptional activator/predicted ATPase